MKSKVIGYWIIIALLVFAIGSGGVAELAHLPANVEGIVHVLGYPLYFLTILGLWKVVGAIALLVPRLPWLKEWAYAGIFVNVTGAAASYAAVGDYGIYAFHQQRRTIMQARMKNPAMILPDAMQAIQALQAATQKGGVPPTTLGLVHLRASQINGCSACVDSGTRHAKMAGESDERLFAVAAWRHAPYFNDAERAALALTEAITRLSDREDPVPDEIWEDASRHYDEPALAALILSIATTNVFNRLNVTTRQVAGAWKPQ